MVNFILMFNLFVFVVFCLVVFFLLILRLGVFLGGLVLVVFFFEVCVMIFEVGVSFIRVLFL